MRNGAALYMSENDTRSRHFRQGVNLPQGVLAKPYTVS